MPTTDEDIVRDLLRRYTADVRPDASVAAGVAARQRRREIRRRAGSAIAAGAALGAAAFVTLGPGKGGGTAQATGTPGKSPTASAATPLKSPSSAPAVTLTSGQRVLYKLSAAAARQAPAQGRYVILQEKESGKLATNTIDTKTGDLYTYQKGSGPFATALHWSPSAAEFAAMPLDVAGLRAVLIRYYKSKIPVYKAPGPVLTPNYQAQVPDYRHPTHSVNGIVFSTAMEFLWNPSTPPALRAALFKVLASVPGVTVDASAHDMKGRAAIKTSWTSAEGTKYTIYEDPSTGTVLQQNYVWAPDYHLAPEYDLMLQVTRTDAIPPDPYTSS